MDNRESNLIELREMSRRYRGNPATLVDNKEFIELFGKCMDDAIEKHFNEVLDSLADFRTRPDDVAFARTDSPFKKYR